MQFLCSVFGGSTMVCIRGSSEPSFSLQSGQMCKQRSAVPLPSPEEGQNVDVGGQCCHSASCAPHQNTRLLIFKSFGKKGDHGIKGALLAESKHKTSELSDICRVNKFITL